MYEVHAEFPTLLLITFCISEVANLITALLVLAVPEISLYPAISEISSFPAFPDGVSLKINVSDSGKILYIAIFIDMNQSSTFVYKVFLCEWDAYIFRFRIHINICITKPLSLNRYIIITTTYSLIMRLLKK